MENTLVNVLLEIAEREHKFYHKLFLLVEIVTFLLLVTIVFANDIFKKVGFARVANLNSFVE